ncbi:MULTISPECIES: DUF4435 domain-containing protein [Bacillus]|uniref:DUF4435 domain-containing protein n=1 Tax=Bacillus cereus (strain ATCC 14579 / DSM 31 / CCUG 7414 / JCM 2152 / NBRC 15305 / NCIMB 9373 / NCTC 2599 / NRRL B-3711) TaxID=226900 RepID=Q81GE3_BACCR|nr:DUF4435 domain-containing protein [Bacillus cereus]AAP08246.1 hypothetical protein BC_1262 [Bacillus cereus ATCC 14579]EEL12443.1 hypothetical protein bcere0015_11340 [Bacillus cereus BDRD-Cer4]KZD86742.1 hypothetical protein B4155_1007 [Bacillus cereus]MCC3286013.1 DUF4435 domain-containing protein [Bacillus cereus]MEB9995731.1 DUF4435 domain-containing protein [Bacillus cereus]
MILDLENLSETESPEDLVEEMLGELDAIEVIFQELVQSKKEHGIDETIFCFYEGKDDFKYYPTRIRTWLELHSNNKSLFSKGCGNRDKVIKVYNKIKFDFEEIDDVSLYFIDRDFNKENNLGKRIYVTPCYAIENLYAKETVLEKFLESHIYINSKSIGKDLKDYCIIREYYVQNLFEKLTQIALINAWYSIQINKKIEDLKNGGEISLDLKKLKSLSDIKKSTSVEEFSEIDIEMLREITDNPYEVTEEEIELELRHIKGDILSNSRGKYIEEILIELYKKIIDETNLPTEFEIEKRSISLPIGKKNFKIHLMPFADTPECFRTYLKERIK